MRLFDSSRGLSATVNKGSDLLKFFKKHMEFGICYVEF